MASCSYIYIYIYIPRCHGNRGKIYHNIYKLKVGSSRLDWDITGSKKPLIVSEALKSCYITPEYGRCEDNNVGVKKLALLQTYSVDENIPSKSNEPQLSYSQS